MGNLEDYTTKEKRIRKKREFEYNQEGGTYDSLSSLLRNGLIFSPNTRESEYFISNEKSKKIKEIYPEYFSNLEYIIKEKHPIEKKEDYINKLEYDEKFTMYKKIINSEFDLEVFSKYDIEGIINANKFNKILIGSQGLGLNYGDIITAENVGEVVLPLVEYIRDLKPDFIVACDRGARLIGLAVYQLYRELHGRLPTTDGTLRFRRISKSNTLQSTEQHLKPLITEILASKENPTVLFLDDWVSEGTTQRIVRDILYDSGKGKIDVRFGVLIGNGANVSGSTKHGSSDVDWWDNPDLIGLDYKAFKPVLVKSINSFDYRSRINKGIKRLAKAIKSREKAQQLAA